MDLGLIGSNLFNISEGKAAYSALQETLLKCISVCSSLSQTAHICCIIHFYLVTDFHGNLFRYRILVDHKDKNKYIHTINIQL